MREGEESERVRKLISTLSQNYGQDPMLDGVSVTELPLLLDEAYCGGGLGGGGFFDGAELGLVAGDVFA
jgi:hypothetical protein